MQYRYVLPNQGAGKLVRRQIAKFIRALGQQFPNSIGFRFLIANHRAEDAQRELYIPFRCFSGVDVHNAGAFFLEE